MEEVFVIEALRTPFGSFGGGLADVPAPQLAAPVIARLLQNTGAAAESVDEVIIGQVLTGGSGQAPARQAMRAAGLPDSVHAMTINKVCGSGLKAIMLAADSILLGNTGIAIAGGMESMSQSPFALPSARYGFRLGNGEVVDLLINDGLRDPFSGRHMGEITEEWVERNGVSREDQDAYAATSYRRAQKAITTGVFGAEIVPVVKKGRKGDIVVDTDEEPLKVDFGRLPSLSPVFRKGGTITAGNASSINDGAALLLLAGGSIAQRSDLRPLARLVASATFSTDPALFAEAPVGAIRKVLTRAGLSMGDIDLFEINEAFAAVPLVAIRQLGLDPERVNVHGGAVSIGHPIGASGGRLAVTLIRELRQRHGRYGLATLCIGGGEAVAVIFEAISA